MPSFRAVSLPSSDSAPCGGRYHCGSTPAACETASSAALDVGTDRPGPHHLLAPMGVGVDRDLVAGGRDLGGEPGRGPDHVTEHEEGGVPTELVEEAQELRRRGRIRPVVEGQRDVALGADAREPG